MAEASSATVWRRLARTVLSPAARHRIAVQLQRASHWSLHLSLPGREARRRLASFKDVHRGERCVVMGNGPSLRHLDLTTLDGVPTFCLNRGYLLWQDSHRKPSYFVAVNDLVIRQFHQEIARLTCPLFLPWAHRDLFRGVANAVFFEVRWDEMFSTDATAGVAPGATVTLAALQLAFYMGFSEIVLLGVDHRFASRGPANAVVHQQEDDANHFHPGYFGPGTTWNLPDLAASESGYARAKLVLDLHGVNIVNATPDSELRVFPTIPFRDALAAALPSRGGHRHSCRP